jgi:hypothetical protein
LQNPSAIENMIGNNGNGTYSIDFQVNGQSDYVTFNNELATMTGGYKMSNGSPLEFDNGNVSWAALVEKAFAQLNEQTAAPHGAQLDAASDSYAGIAGGSGEVFTELTGQSVSYFNLNSMGPSTLTSLGATLSAEFKSGTEMEVDTGSAASGNIVAGHAYEVLGVSAAGVVSLQNPWNTAGTSSGLQMDFTESLSQLSALGCSVFASSPSTGHAAKAA